MLSMLERSIRESETYARLMEQAHALGDPSLEFAERSRIYRERGLASDTSLRVNFAVEQALREIAAADWLSRDYPCRVIGPGLDFVDKQEGYDFYPPQTISPSRDRFAHPAWLAEWGLCECPRST